MSKAIKSTLIQLVDVVGTQTLDFVFLRGQKLSLFILLIELIIGSYASDGTEASVTKHSSLTVCLPLQSQYETLMDFALALFFS